jgi:hypothetical protein
VIGLPYVALSIVIVVLWRGRCRKKPRWVAALVEAMHVDKRFQAQSATASAQIKCKVVVEGFYGDGFSQNGQEDHLKPGDFEFRFVEWKDRQGHVWLGEFARPGHPLAQQEWIATHDLDNAI